MAVCLEPVDAVNLLLEFCQGRVMFVNPGGCRQAGGLLDPLVEVGGQVVEAQTASEVADQAGD